MKDIIKQNKGLTFEYDLLGHPVKVNGKTSTIEYVYAPDGRKLRATHKTFTSATKNIVKTSTTTDYTNGYIFKNSKPSMFSFDGGYYSFDGQGKLNGCHYYIADYQGNNRMVVNAATNRTEQVTHYYPFGELMADISTSPDAQQFKYNGKELDRSFGLDLYDYHARQQDAKLGRFNSIDPLAEKYYGISPYSYCAGDPVNCVDKDGRDVYTISNSGFVAKTNPSKQTVLIFYSKGTGEVTNVRKYDSRKGYDVALDNMVTETVELAPGIKSEPLTYGKMENEQALELQNIMTQNTDVEWNADVTSSGVGVLSTSHNVQKVESGKARNKSGIAESDVTISVHGHPGRNADDGSASEGTRGGGDGDRKNAKGNTRYFVNHQGSGHIFEYNAKQQNIREWKNFDEWYKSISK